jgi:hypothetical protein
MFTPARAAVVTTSTDFRAGVELGGRAPVHGYQLTESLKQDSRDRLLGQAHDSTPAIELF